MYGKKELYIAIFSYTKGGSLMNSIFASSYELLLSAISELELRRILLSFTLALIFRENVRFPFGIRSSLF